MVKCSKKYNPIDEPFAQLRNPASQPSRKIATLQANIFALEDAVRLGLHETLLSVRQRPQEPGAESSGAPSDCRARS